VFQSSGADSLAPGDGSDIAGTGTLNGRSPRYRAAAAKGVHEELRYGVTIRGSLGTESGSACSRERSTAHRSLKGTTEMAGLSHR